MRHAAIAGGVTIVGIAAILFFAVPHKTNQLAGGQPMLPTTTLTIGNTTLTVELATTAQQEEQGLSGRSRLAEGTGMLFIFDPMKTPGFWMKDMRFSLDIIFAKADGTIVTIYPDLSPATYPQSYHPTEPVRYVLEVPAGFALQHGISVGQKLVLQNE